MSEEEGAMSETNRHEASHDEIRSRLSAWLDDDLDPGRRAAVSRHLRSCAACRALLGDLERIREEARALPPCEPERDLWPGIRAAMGSTGVARQHAHEVGPVTATRPDAAADVPPDVPPDVPRIADGARKEPAAWGAAFSGARRGLFLTLPQLAAAALVVLAIGVSGGWWLAPVASAGSPGSASPTATEATRGPPSDEVGPGSAATDGAEVPAALPAEARELGDEAEVLRTDFEERSGVLDGRTVRTVADNLAVIDRAIREAENAYVRSPGSVYLERHLVESYRRKVTYLRDAVAVTSWSADG